MSERERDEPAELEHAIRSDAPNARAVLATTGRSVLSQALGVLAAATAAWSGMEPTTAALVAPTAAVGFDTLFAAIGTGRKSLEAAQQLEALRALASRVDELQQRLDELTAKRASEGKPPPSVGDVAAVLTLYLDAAQSAADEEKRRVLTNAVVNAFDPELYNAGLTRTLFAILERLEYGDVHTLRAVVKKHPHPGLWSEAGSLRSFHAARLEAEQLIRREMTPSVHWLMSDRVGTEEPELRPSKNDNAHVTELGRRLVALAADPLPAEPQPRAKPAARRVRK